MINDHREGSNQQVYESIQGLEEKFSNLNEKFRKQVEIWEKIEIFEMKTL
jgi:hypothetical protein